MFYWITWNWLYQHHNKVSVKEKKKHHNKAITGEASEIESATDIGNLLKEKP